jgi:hypothetical protein
MIDGTQLRRRESSTEFGPCAFSVLLPIAVKWLQDHLLAMLSISPVSGGVSERETFYAIFRNYQLDKSLHGRGIVDTGTGTDMQNHRPLH